MILSASRRPAGASTWCSDLKSAHCQVEASRVVTELRKELRAELKRIEKKYGKVRSPTTPAALKKLLPMQRPRLRGVCSGR